MSDCYASGGSSQSVQGTPLQERAHVRHQWTDDGDRVRELVRWTADLAHPMAHLGRGVNVDAARVGRTGQRAAARVVLAHRNKAAAMMATSAGMTIGGMAQANM